jgi:hypothetical protein
MTVAGALIDDPEAATAFLVDPGMELAGEAPVAATMRRSPPPSRRGRPLADKADRTGETGAPDPSARTTASHRTARYQAGPATFFTQDSGERRRDPPPTSMCVPLSDRRLVIVRLRNHVGLMSARPLT